MKKISLLLTLLLLSPQLANASSPTLLQNKIAISNQASTNGASATITVNSTTYLYKVNSSGDISISQKGKLLEARVAGKHYLSTNALIAIYGDKLTNEQIIFLKKKNAYIILNQDSLSKLAPTYIDTLQPLTNQSENMLDPSTTLKYEKTRTQERFTFKTLLGTNKTLTFNNKSLLTSAIIRNGSETTTISYRYAKQAMPKTLKIVSPQDLLLVGINL